MPETSSTHLKNDRKEDAKRDTNDFLRESANPAEDSALKPRLRLIGTSCGVPISMP